MTPKTQKRAYSNMADADVAPINENPAHILGEHGGGGQNGPGTQVDSKHAHSLTYSSSSPDPVAPQPLSEKAAGKRRAVDPEEAVPLSPWHTNLGTSNPTAYPASSEALVSSGTSLSSTSALMPKGVDRTSVAWEDSSVRAAVGAVTRRFEHSGRNHGMLDLPLWDAVSSRSGLGPSESASTASTSTSEGPYPSATGLRTISSASAPTKKPRARAKQVVAEADAHHGAQHGPSDSAIACATRPPSRPDARSGKPRGRPSKYPLPTPAEGQGFAGEVKAEQGTGTFASS